MPRLGYVASAIEDRELLRECQEVADAFTVVDCINTGREESMRKVERSVDALHHIHVVGAIAPVFDSAPGTSCPVA